MNVNKRNENNNTWLVAFDVDDFTHVEFSKIVDFFFHLQ